MERSRGGVCRHGGSFPIAFRRAAISWFKLTHYQALHELHVQPLLHLRYTVNFLGRIQADPLV